MHKANGGLIRSSCSCCLQRTRPFFRAHRGPSVSQGHSTDSHPVYTQSSSLRRRGLLQGLLHGTSLLLAAGGLNTTTVSMAAAADSKASQVLQDPQWPDALPFEADDFRRFDESKDAYFYSQPRFVTHIDDQAIAALTDHYKETLPPSGTPNAAVLDLCSSWISHYPPDYKLDKVVGLGMNEAELAKNPVLTDYTVRDLNDNPRLPFDDNSFDVITNAVSVDYLNRPIEVFKEMHRVLKPGGRAIMSFSNRCFPTKAIAIWTRTADLDHIWIVGAYYHYSVPGGWSEPEGIDISSKGGLFGRSDPMYVVTATKV